jgi:hypothetical protein
MRAFFAAVVFLFGAALAFGYPIMAKRLPPMPIGTWPVYVAATGFMSPIDARLTADDAPVLVYVDLTSAGAPKFDKEQAVLTLTASLEGKTLLAEPLTFEDAVTRDDTPQTPELIYRAKAGAIDTVGADSFYRFSIGPGDAEGIDMAKVDLVLEHGRQKVDSRAQPIGLSVMAVGAIAFLLSLRSGSGSPPPNPNSKPPPPRWGRGAADRK